MQDGVIKKQFTTNSLDGRVVRASASGAANKPASLLVVSLGNALSGIPPSWCARQQDCALELKNLNLNSKKYFF